MALELDSWSVVGHRALEAEAVNLAELDHGAMADRFVSLEGLVERQFMEDDRHLSMEMVVDGYLVKVFMLLDPKNRCRNGRESMIRVNGVYAPKLAPDGRLPPSTCGVRAWRRPNGSVRWPMRPQLGPSLGGVESLIEQPMDGQVVVRGTYIGAAREGEGLLLRDETGQIALATAQRQRPQPGDLVEAIGFPRVEGVQIQLEQALWRSGTSDEVSPAENRTPSRRHRVAASVRELSPLRAAAGEPVQITGVVTWSDPARRLVFVQDSSSGIAVRWDPSVGDLPRAGTLVTVTGSTAAGDFAPYIAVTDWQEGQDVELPKARPITREQAMTGLEEAQLVQLTGYVFNAELTAEGLRLDLATSSGEMRVRVAGDTDGTRWLGAVITAKGVCVAQADDSRRLVVAEIWVANPLGIEVVQDGVDNPFDFPLTPMRELGRFNPNAIMRDRLKVEGTVVWVEDDGGIWLHDGGVTLEVHTRQSQRANRGERIEAVGFLGMDAGQRILREGVWRSVGRAESRLELEDRVKEASVKHGDFTRIAGRVEEVYGWSNRVRIRLTAAALPPLLVEVAGVTVEQIQKAAPMGARVEAMGLVLRQHAAAPGDPEVRILVKGPEDLRTLEFPPWWTRERLMVFILLALLMVVAGLLWIAVLRRVVRKQMNQIDEQSRRARELQEELERTQRMESLGSMAEGITQDFEHLLQRIHAQIGEVLQRERLAWENRNRLDQAQAAVLRAQDLTRRLASFSLTGKSVREPMDWTGFLRREVEAFELGPFVKLVWNLPENTSPVKADAAQLQQVIQGLLRNAVQAMPNGGTIKITLSRERIASGDLAHLLPAGEYLRTSITDSGSGIAAEDLGRIFEPYFSRKPNAKGLGLAMAYAVMRQHQGRLEVDSIEGKGTTVWLWFPVRRGELDAPGD